MLRVVGVLGGDQVDVPFQGVRHFHDGEEFGEVVLDTRQVHFVEDDEVGVGAVARFINRTEEVGLGEALGEVVIEL